MSFDASHITCKHPRDGLKELISVSTKRYRCQACGFLLYSRRNSSKLKHYACEFTRKVVVRIGEDGTEHFARRSVCSEPASNFVGTRGHPRCTEHTNPRVSQDTKVHMKESKRAMSKGKEDMEEFEKRCKEIREEIGDGSKGLFTAEPEEESYGGVMTL